MNTQAIPSAELRKKNRAIPFDDLPEYLTPEEVSTYLGLSRNTVYDRIHRGEIPHVRFGRLIRISKTALRESLTPAALVR